MIYMSWNGFCMIRVGEQLPDGLTRDVRSLRWSVMVRWPPIPPKIEKDKFVLKCILGHFQYSEPMFFLVENQPIRTSTPLLLENSVENSTKFFFWKLPFTRQPKKLAGTKRKSSVMPHQRVGQHYSPYSIGLYTITCTEPYGHWSLDSQENCRCSPPTLVRIFGKSLHFHTFSFIKW